MNESIDTRLKQSREKRQLGFEQVSEATKIRAHYLQALESDDLSAIPSAAQARGFLRIYADFLGLQASDLVPPQPAPAPSSSAASVEPVTQPKAGVPSQPVATGVGPARPGLLDNLRGLFRGRGKAISESGEVPAAEDAARGPAERTPDSPAPDKKKLNI